MSTPSPAKRPGGTDRRLELVERDVDRLLDPETGIYAQLRAMESRLKSVAIMILLGILINLVVQLVKVHFG